MKDLRFSKNLIGLGESITRSVQFSDTEIGLDIPEIEFLQFIEGEIRFLRLSEGLYFKGSLQSNIEIPCRRCLALYETKLHVPFSLDFIDNMDVADRMVDGEVVDLTEDLKQTIALEIPCWPLCQDACQGLCVSCGCDLNSQACSCQSNLTTSSPFGHLENMLQSTDSNTNN